MTSAFMRKPGPEDQVIVLRPYLNPSEGQEFPLGARRWLAGCTHWCWIAPSSRDLLQQNPDWMTWCRDCAAVDLVDRPRALHPAQRRELLEAGMTEDELRADMTLLGVRDGTEEDFQ